MNSGSPDVSVVFETEKQEPYHRIRLTDVMKAWMRQNARGGVADWIVVSPRPASAEEAALMAKASTRWIERPAIHYYGERNVGANRSASQRFEKLLALDASSLASGNRRPHCRSVRKKNLARQLLVRAKIPASGDRDVVEADRIKSPMGPVWRLIRGEKDICHRCGREILDFPAVGRVVDYKFLPEEKYCWECYRYIRPFVNEVAPESAEPFQPVTKPAIP